MEGQRERAAVIGLGSMGLGIAQSLLRAGRSVSGYDPDPVALAKFADLGGAPALDAAEAARDANAVVVVVVNAAQTEAVLFGRDTACGITKTMRQDGVILSSATMAPADARRFADRCAEVASIISTPQ